MITKDQIEQLLEEGLGEGPIFVVKLDVSAGNDIRVLIDNDEGIAISDCVKVSRMIEGSYDRDLEDFSLNVSSPGADQPLMVKRQYVKNVGRGLKVKTTEGLKIEGTLEAADDENITVVVREKRRIEGRKAKEWLEEKHTIAYADIDKATVVISFKK